MELKTEWDFSEIKQTEEEEKKERKIIEKGIRSFIEKYQSKKDYLENPKKLKEALEDLEKLEEKGTSGNQGYYYQLKFYQDQLNPKTKAKTVQISEFSTKLSNDLQFFHLNIAKISKEKQKEFLNSPELKKYNHMLEKIFENAKYLLTESEEKILSLKEKTSYEKWVDMVASKLSKEERKIRTVKNGKEAEERKNFSEISNLLNNKNKKVRDSAAEAFNDILEKNYDIAEEEINAILLDKKVNDELRKLETPDKARHLSDDIRSETVQSLIKAVTKRFDISKRYYRLKARLFKKERLDYHERNVPYGNLEKEYPYEESLELVKKVLGHLDEEFLEIINNISNGKIDVFPKKGKMHGAYCFHHLKSQPTYILLNHTDRLQDVLTLAHELGHGINNELMKKKQPAIYIETPKSTAEVASTFMEDFVLQDLLKEANEETKLSLLMTKLNDDISTIMRQVACYNFEIELHKEFRKTGYLSKEEIGKIFQKNMKDYMGDSITHDEKGKNWWVHWPHIREFFYVYSYASGLLISKAMQNKTKQNPKFIEKVKEFLSAGTSKSPEKLFRELGITLNEEFWNAGLEEIEALIKETEQLAKKLKKF